MSVQHATSKHYALYKGLSDRESPSRFRIDNFRAFVQAGVGSYVDLDGRPVVEQVVNRRDPISRAAQQSLLDLIDKHLRVYAVTPDLLEAAMEATYRSLKEDVPAPPWPVLPLWVEWPGAYLGDDPAEPRGFTICAVMVGKELARQRNKTTGDAQDIEIVRVTLIGLDNTQKALLFLPSGEWATEQMGPCMNRACSIAQRTQPDHLYWCQQRRDMVEAGDTGCSCWFGGYSWSRILWSLMHLLQAKGLTVDQLDRAIPLPPKPKSSKQLGSWRNDVNKIQARNRATPRITRLSWDDLQTGQRARVVRNADGTRALMYEEQAPTSDSANATHLDAFAPVREGVVRRAHPRLLIADANHRWLPPTRIIAVHRSRPYSMRVQSNTKLPPVRLVIEGRPANGLHAETTIVDEAE